MIDTNAITQTASAVQQLAAQGGLNLNWPAIGAAALWLRSDIRKILEWVMLHGGFGWLAWKLIWNPPPTVSTIATYSGSPQPPTFPTK